MNVRYLLLISLLIVGLLFVPAVSAFEYQKTSVEHKSFGTGPGSSSPGSNVALRLSTGRIQDWTDLKSFTIDSPYNIVAWGGSTSKKSGLTSCQIKQGSTVIGTGIIYFTVNNLNNHVIVTIELDTFNPTGTGTIDYTVVYNATELGISRQPQNGYWYRATPESTNNIHFAAGDKSLVSPGTYYTVSRYDWHTNVNFTDYDTYTEIQIIRDFGPNDVNYANVKVSSDTRIYYSGNENTNIAGIRIYESPIYVSVSNAYGDNYSDTYIFAGASPVDPEDPGDLVTNRTGTVTMTDHNGTSISGFEVTAVNVYTGEEYTESTATDVAVMTLPMDRTIEIRNPQTGVYETAPIGYYKFYGTAPGYKMLLEDGIQVAVMPEKYGSYQLCDILVTSESGPLTGQHKFQIRSRSDNSVLQTGTISAQSATTGEWYNETVTDGIATLILPYDTSNPISQYAGNYYVYATSPGYEDSDYGTQIVVMPHTVSEINTILLTPIGGIPAAGNVTLRIQAFSEYGPGVANAQIFIAGVIGAGSSVWDTYTASSTGYLEVSVPGNSTYDIVASAEGYYDSARRIEVFTEPPGLIEIKLYLSGAPTVEPTTQPTGWPTTQPTTQPTGGIPDDDDGSESFLMQAVRGIGKAFGVGFSTAKLIFGMLLALSIGFATAKHLRGGAAEFGLGLVGGTMLGVLIGLLPVWTVVVLLLIVGLYIGNRYVGGANNG